MTEEEKYLKINHIATILGEAYGTVGRAENRRAALEVVELFNQTPPSSTYPIDKRHICFDSGHNMYLLTEIDNGYSKYGTHKCSRCGFEDHFQYDYKERL